MTDPRESEIESIVRMLLYLRSEMSRNKLNAALGHIDASLDAIAREYKQEADNNVIEFTRRNQI